jgi:RHS repeat-associated protein
VVDALGELAGVDGASLMWDSADPMGPLAWFDGAGAVGHGAPWALGGERLAPDWQGTVGAGGDSWGAGGPAADSGPRLGYRGEVELNGLTWLRNRVYDPATRAFLSRDPLPGVPGTSWFANPYQYGGNNPLGLADPLGLRPVTDKELDAYRDQMASPLQKATEWVGDNWEYIAAGVAIVAGVGLMFTGIGGPAGVALLAASGGLVSAGASAAVQKATTGEVDWGKVAMDGAIGAAAGGLGAGAGMVVGQSARLAALNPGARAVAQNATEAAVEGMASRGLSGENPFNPRGLAEDLVGTGKGKAVGGELGAARAAADDTLMRAAGGGKRRKITLPMHPDTVHDVADRYGVDISDLGKIKINKVVQNVRGSTAPDQRVTLYRDAFENEVELAKTLKHERYHVEQLRDGMPYPKDYDEGAAWETEAEEHAERWMASHPLNPGNQ